MRTQQIRVLEEIRHSRLARFSKRLNRRLSDPKIRPIREILNYLANLVYNINSDTFLYNIYRLIFTLTTRINGALAIKSFVDLRSSRISCRTLEPFLALFLTVLRPSAFAI